MNMDGSICSLSVDVLLSAILLILLLNIIFPRKLAFSCVQCVCVLLCKLVFEERESNRERDREREREVDR